MHVTLTHIYTIHTLCTYVKNYVPFIKTHFLSTRKFRFLQKFKVRFGCYLEALLTSVDFPSSLHYADSEEAPEPLRYKAQISERLARERLYCKP